MSLSGLHADCNDIFWISSFDGMSLGSCTLDLKGFLINLPPFDGCVARFNCFCSFSSAYLLITARVSAASSSGDINTTPLSSLVSVLLFCVGEDASASWMSVSLQVMDAAGTDDVGGVVALACAAWTGTIVDMNAMAHAAKNLICCFQAWSLFEIDSKEFAHRARVSVTF